MDYTYDVAVLVGSLRRASLNRKLAHALAELAPPALSLDIVEIGRLPLYNQDDEGTPPAEWPEFRSRIAVADAVLFVTPEYNRSIPGGLKNAIDWGSRPYGKNSFSRKPSGVIGASPGKIGTAVAQTHLRSILCFCNSPLMNMLEAYIQFTPGLITDTGEVTDDAIGEFLSNYMKEFHGFISRVYSVLPRTA
jgi:chromate reductase, NAD(P)H dehydrogenase (quinone)